MALPVHGWKNKGGTADRACRCGSWKQHWINFSGEAWPSQCCVEGCTAKAEVGAHVINPDVSGEYIAPVCQSCNMQTGSFTLKGSVTLVPANKQETCEA